MTTLSSDSFSRSNQSGLGTASDGEAWVRDAGIGVSNIVSNQGKIGPGGNDSQFLIGSQTAGTVNCLCRIKSGDAGNVAAVLFRYSSTGGASANGYRAGIFGANLVVDKYVSGTRTNIGSTSVGYVVGDEWWVRAVASSTSIKVTAWKDGTSEPGSPQLNLTDNSVASGQYGISVFMSNDFTYFDSLTVTDNQSSTTTTTVSITETNPLTESFILWALLQSVDAQGLLESVTLSGSASYSEASTLSERWTITGATVTTESNTTSESVSLILATLPTETVTLSEAAQLAMSLVKSESNPLTESFFAGPPSVEQPTHAILTLAAARGTIAITSANGTLTLTAARDTLAMTSTNGTLTLKAARGTITLEGV